MQPKILYLNFSNGFGGLEIFSFNLFNWLNQKYDIFFFLQKDSPLHKKLLYYKNVFPLDTFKYFDFETILKIHNFVKKEKIKIIHTFKSSDIWLAVLATKILKIKGIKIIHHLQMLPTHKRKDLFHIFLYKHLDKIITISEQMCERVRSFWPVKKEIVETVYYGIDLNKFDYTKFNQKEVRKKYSIPENKIVLGIIGQICYGKGQFIVLKAFNELLKKRNDIFLIIGGQPPKGDEQYLDELKYFIKTHQLEDKVLFTGFCDNVPELLSALDIFILGSKEESFGLVVIEAMAMGKITIGTNAGGVPEIIIHNQNGFLYESFNIEELASLLEYVLIMSAEKKEKIIVNAINTIKNKFSLTIFLEKIEKIYNILIDAI